MPRDRGQTYQLERLPPGLMRHVKARAALEGRSVRAVLVAFLEEYAAPRTLTPEPVARLSAGARSESREAPMTEDVESPPPTPVSSTPDLDLGF